MQTLLNVECRKEVLDRLSGLSPDDKPKWGTMSAPQMVAHVSRQLKCAFGLEHDKPLSTIWQFWPFRNLVIYILPWPHHLPTADAWKNPKRDGWDREIDQLRKLIQKFSVKDDTVEWGTHPILGKLDAKDWAVVSYRHIDHHLRQFGT